MFGGFGLGCLLASFGAGAWALWLKFFDDTSLIQTPLPLLAVFLAGSGIISILMGLLAEMLNRTYHESQQKAVYRLGRVLRGGQGD